MSNTISRRDFLKLTGMGLGALRAITSPVGGALADQENSSALIGQHDEEKANGIDLSLSDEHKAELEKQWETMANVNEFGNYHDYFIKIATALNVTRARDLRGQDFIDLMSGVIQTPVVIGPNRKGLSVVGEICDYLQFYSSVRDQCLDGTVPTSIYNFYSIELFQTILASQKNDIGDNSSVFFNSIGDNELAYTPLANQDVKNYLGSDREKSVYSPPDFFVNGGAPTDLWDSSVRDVRPGYVQKPITELSDLQHGDILFRDKNKTEYQQGHPMMVLETNHYSRGYLDSNDSRAVVVVDPSMGGKMLVGVYGINSAETFSDVFGNPIENCGLLRTKFADNAFYLNKAHLLTALNETQIPPAIAQGRQETLPDFNTITEIASQWPHLASPKDRTPAINNIINLVGLHVRDKDGNLAIGPRWQDRFGNNYWTCSLYAQTLFPALGIKDMAHRFVDNHPSQNNEGEEYDAARMNEWMNIYGRQHNFINTTHMTPKERDKILPNHVYMGTAKGHMWTIVPITNEVGECIPTLSQNGFDRPLSPVDYAYKYYDPAYHYDVYQEPTRGILWAHALPGCPESPIKARLFGHLRPDESSTPEQKNQEGWLSTITELKTFADDAQPRGLSGFFELFKDTSEKLPTDNHIFKFAFDMAKLIQDYQLPLGIPLEKDPDYFIDYLKKGMISKGYKKIAESATATTAFNNIRANFLTPEKSHQLNIEQQSIQCVGFDLLLSAARGKLDWAPVVSTGISSPDAENIAKYILDNGYATKSETAVKLNSDLPNSVDNFKAGDTFYISYGPNTSGHVGVICSDPFINANGEKCIAVADSNRIVRDNNGEISITADGMPRVRLMTIENFILQYHTGKSKERIGRTVILRPNKRK